MSGHRTLAAAGATAAVVVGLSGLVSAPLVAALTLPSSADGPTGGGLLSGTLGPAGIARWALLGGLLLWLAVAVAVAVALAGLRRPPRRQWWLPLRAQHRLEAMVELSAFGVGGLRGWTDANPRVGLDRVRRPSADDVTRRLRLPAGGGSGADRRHRRPTGDQPNDDPRATARHRRRDGAGGDGTGGWSGPAATPAPPPDPRLSGPLQRHDIQRGETWWSLAERHLGDGRRWTALRDLNLGVEAAPGVLIDQDSVLRPGWRINVPAPAGEAAPGVWSPAGGNRATARN